MNSGRERAGLSRSGPDGRPLAPVGQVHLGLGSFFRAHQAWYTEHSPDRDEWGIAAFTGRSATLALTLTRQDALYTLVTRSAADDAFEVISSLSAALPAGDGESFLRYLADPSVRVLTLTVTEAGYRRDRAGNLDLADPAVQADLADLRARAGPAEDGQAGPAIRAAARLRGADRRPGETIPGRLVAGLAARYAAGGAPLTIVPCDNLPGNGAVVARVTAQFAELIDPGLAEWIGTSVSFASTVVDRITPRLAGPDIAEVAAATDRTDRAPVVTEPFSEWIIDGQFPAGRPAWEQAGATFAPDITPFEQRKLWLLNAGHSLLAYAGSLRGHETIAGAIGDETCRGWLDQWWQEATPHLLLPASELAAYQDALLTRFANGRIRHLLAQIAADGSQKLPVRVLPVLLAERAAGRLPGGAIRILAAWLCHLRGAGAPVSDPRADELMALASGSLGAAAGRILGALDPDLADDRELVAATTALARELGQS
jgi:fructuronate reductase